MDFENSEAAKLAKVEAATFEWGSFLSTPIGKAVGGLAILLLMQLTSWITSMMQPVPPAPPSPVVVVTPDNPTKPPSPSPIVPPATSKGSIKLFLTTATKDLASSIKDLPLTVDANLYEVGSTYPFAGVEVPLPCVELRNKTGTIVLVESVDSAAGIIAAWKKVQP